jgi:hypothetical protein
MQKFFSFPFWSSTALATASVALAACGGAAPATDDTNMEAMVSANEAGQPDICAVDASSLLRLEHGIESIELESFDPERFASFLAGYTAAEDETIDIFMRSDEFDTRLVVYLPDGAERENDDYEGGSTDSRLRVQLLAGENIRVSATTFAPGEAGMAELEIAPVSREGGTELSGPVMLEDTLSPDRTEYTYWVQLTTGQQLNGRLRSMDFDTVLHVESPTGVVWENDDAGDIEDGAARATDSTLELAAGSTGWYSISVRSYGGEAVGTYDLEIDIKDPVSVPVGQESPVGGFAGSSGRGRILGLYAGITDYDQGPLYHCAEDAGDIKSAMVTRGLQSTSEHVLLQNTDATVAAFENGLRSLARTATPDDVVLIFYSGHGGVVTDTSAPGTDVELDGTDETLVFYDGEMTDDKFARMLDRIHADTIIIAIDACQSGGFRRDVMTRPGRIGLFSSDEDVLSDTAQSLESGGYLSFTLRESLLGLADSRPRDGLLSAGELVDAMVDGFARYHRTINPQADISPTQRLVVDRGSVAWSTRLWMYPFGQGGELFGAEHIPAAWTAPAGEETDDEDTTTPAQVGVVGGSCGG